MPEMSNTKVGLTQKTLRIAVISQAHVVLFLCMVQNHLYLVCKFSFEALACTRREIVKLMLSF